MGRGFYRMARRGMTFALMLLCFLLTVAGFAQVTVLGEQRIMETGVWQNDLLKGSDTTGASYIRKHITQGWPTRGFTVVSWSDSFPGKDVPETTFTETRYQFENGGDWSSWSKICTLLAPFIRATTTKRYVALTMPALKPYAWQVRDVTVDSNLSVPCSTTVHHNIWGW